MNRHAVAASLRGLPELAGLGPRDTASLLAYFDEVRVGPGTTLALAGRPATEYVVVLEGSLETWGPHGRRTVRAGQSSGWDAMWNRASSPSTVTAVEPSRLLVMGRAQFRAARALRGRLAEPGRARVAQAPSAAGADVHRS